MSIEIDEFAKVSISISPTGVASGNFGILGFLTKVSDSATVPISPAERLRPYTSLTSVGNDWPASSEVYLAATAFYAQTPTPVDFVVLMNYDLPQVANLVGGGIATIEELQAITSGSFTISIDGVEVASSAVDLSGANTFAEVADIITTLVNAVVTGSSCLYTKYGFTVVGATASSLGTISYATGTVADAMGLQAHQAKISNGVDAETPVDSLVAVASTGKEVVAIVTHKDFRDVLSGAVGETTSEIADWCEGESKIFMNTSNDLSVLNSIITTDIASTLKAKTLRFSLTTFSKNVSQYPSAAVFGRAASVNFNGVSQTITLNLKQISTVTADDLTPTEFATLRGKFASAVVVIGDSATGFTDSRMASGTWLDTVHGLLWLQNRIEVDMFNLLYQSNTKVPYSQTGINTVSAVLERSLQAAVRNGLASQGFLSDGTYLPEGYLITALPIDTVPSADKSNRIYLGISFVMSGSGALQEIEVNGSFSE